MKALNSFYITLILMSLLSANSIARTWHIKPDGSGDAPTIRAAIDSAATGDTVLLAAGTYAGEGNCGKYFRGKEITLRSESGQDVTIIDCQGCGPAFVIGYGEGSSLVLSGLTIRGGIYCNGTSPTLIDVTFSGNSAPGMSCDNGSPTLTNVTFSGISGTGMSCGYSSPVLTNVIFSGNSGSGMYCSNSSPVLTNVIFSGNSASGMWIDGHSNPTLTNVTFSRNSNDLGGGMLNMSLGNPTLINVTFSENSATSGGGMYNHASDPTIVNVTFMDNSATSWGGGMYNYSSSPRLTNVTFSENSATSGGGMINGDHSFPALTNVVFSGNSADSIGGGMLSGLVSCPILTNVTFSDNSAPYGGGMYNFNESSPTLVNTILWGDSASIAGNEIFNSDSRYIPPIISYSLVEGSGGSGGGWDASLGTDGGHNIDADPLFANAVGGNLRLSLFGSPAVNAGNNAAVPAGVTTDLDGNPRIAGGTVDMGAYEFKFVAAIGSDNIPKPFQIVSVSPNPFNPSTTVHFTLPAMMRASVEIWSVTGAQVRVLSNNQLFGPGDNRITWDGRNGRGSPVSSGVYFIRIETRLGARATRAVLLR